MPALVPAVLRDEPQFRLLFAGQALSVLGDRVVMVALPFAVLSIGGSATQVGLVAAALAVPFLLFGLLGGVWADRLPRHRLMLASDVVRLAVQAVAAGLLLTGTAEVWHLAVLMAIFGTADAFFQPALVGLMPAVVGADRLQEANALRSLTMSLGLVIGPAIGGLSVALLGPGGAFAFDAATFAASCLALLLLRPRTVERVEQATRGVLAELRGGWHEVRSRSWVVAFLALFAAYHVVVLPAISVLGPVLAERDHGGASSWAVVVAAFGVGAIAGDLLVLRLRVARPLAVGAAAFCVASCQAAIIGSGLPIAAIAALEALTGVAVSVGFTLWETSLQEHIPEHAISRVTSFDYLASVGLMPVGLVLAGPLADLVGLHLLLVLETLVAVPLALAVLALPSVRAVGSRAHAAAAQKRGTDPTV